MRAPKSFLLICALSLCAIARSATIPSPVHRMRDTTNTLGAMARAEIESICNSLESATGAEIGLLVLPSTDGENHHAFALRAFNQWGIGKRGKNNGLLIFFALNDHRVEIIPGDYYQKLFTAQYCTQMLERVTVPKMKAGQDSQGIKAAVAEAANVIRDYERNGRVAPSASGISQWFGGTQMPDGIHLLLIIGIVVWLGVLILLVILSLVGQPVMSRSWLYFWIILLLLPLCYLGFEAVTTKTGPVDLIVGGVGFVGFIALLCKCGGVCPRCGRGMTVSSRTLSYATCYSSGLSERTEHCNFCHHHGVSTSVTAPRERRHYSSSWSSSSYSSRSSSGGSFGGGSSSGGGGGASW